MNAPPLLLLVPVGAGAVVLIQQGSYGWTLFVALPVIVGAIGAAMKNPETSLKSALYGACTAGLALGGFLVLGLEGILCIVMAAPLALPLGYLGGMLAWAMNPRKKESTALLMILPLVTLSWDFTAKPQVFEVHSSIEIAATPKQVWQNVVSFSDLPEPDEWYFQTGLAYPKRARIEGTGPGAIRYCEFSTGPFVEPIEVWDEPRLLQFRVTQSPAPIHEWSPYANVTPKHLHGYLISKKGQFLLTALPNGRTRLEGTTWYQHGLWPGFYWSWWSEAIIHRIHLRVLTHIKNLSEAHP